jgi:hypothetical protein
MERINYTDFEGGFSQVVLEESFVLNLKTTMSFVDFQINLAVNESYPLYTPPEEDFEYSFRRGRIFFPNMEQVRWVSRIQPYIDPGSGSVDYGAIDYFYKDEEGYHLAGFWGELDIVCGPPILEIEELLNQGKENAATQQQV